MSGRFLAIDIGCLECQNETEIIGVFATRDEAIAALPGPFVESVRYAESNCRVFDLGPES